MLNAERKFRPETGPGPVLPVSVVDDDDGREEDDDGQVVDEDEDAGEESEGLDAQQGGQGVAEEGRHGGEGGVEGGAGCPPDTHRTDMSDVTKPCTKSLHTGRTLMAHRHVQNLHTQDGHV